MNELFDNYYFQSILYSVIFILFSFTTINSMKKRKIDINDRFNINKIDFIFLIKLICFSFFIRIILDLIQIGFDISQSDVTFNMTLIGIIVFILSRCIIAPITEEIVFRFGLYELLSKKLKTVLAIFLTSIIFSILHGYLLYDTFLMVILSIMWTCSYYKTKNLFYPIALHFLHNCYALIGYLNISNIYYIFLAIINFIIFLILEIKKWK